MASSPRIVAELGRAETPDETAQRKAASSAAYRSSKTFRNLIAALLATVAVVAIVVFGVPRGSYPDPEPVDVAAAARAASESLGRDLIVPTVPDSWRANSARLENDTWRVVYAPETGFVRIAQGFDADDRWPAQVLDGAAPTGTVDVAGITWDEYTIRGSRDGIRYALSTPAGGDRILLYGSTTAAEAAVAAAGLADQIHQMREEAP